MKLLIVLTTFLAILSVLYANISISEPLNFNIDTTPPTNLSFISPTPVNNSNLSKTFIPVNISFSEERLDTCLLELIYPNGTAFNSTMAYSTTCFKNATNLQEGNYSFRVFVNDTGGRINTSETRKITLDTTSPNASLSITDDTLNLNENVTVLCSSSDSLTGIKSEFLHIIKPDSSEMSFSCNSVFSDTSSTGTYKARYITIDNADNIEILEVEFTVSDASTSSGGGSSGGSSGGMDTTKQGESVKEDSIIYQGPFISLEPGTHTIEIPDERIGISKIELCVNSKIENAFLLLNTPSRNPTQIEFNGAPNKFIEIVHNNLEDNDLCYVIIEFEVEKSWIEERNATPDDVSLFRLEKTSWNSLPTEMADETDEKVYYVSNSTGLSFYLIGIIQDFISPPENVVKDNDSLIVCGDGICSESEINSCSRDCQPQNSYTTFTDFTTLQIVIISGFIAIFVLFLVVVPLVRRATRREIKKELAIAKHSVLGEERRDYSRELDMAGKLMSLIETEYLSGIIDEEFYLDKKRKLEEKIKLLKEKNPSSGFIAETDLDYQQEKKRIKFSDETLDRLTSKIRKLSEDLNRKSYNSNINSSKNFDPLEYRKYILGKK